MKIKCLALFCLVLICGSVKAQTSDTTYYKNQFGIIASPRLEKLFSSNRSLPVGLIYRRQVKTDRAYRVSVTGAFNKYSNNPAINGLQITQNNISIFTQVGHEWQNQLGNRSIFYWGSDLGFGFNRSEFNQDFSNVNLDPANAYGFVSSTDKTMRYALKPFAGFRYKVHSRFQLAAETTVEFAYSRTNSDNTTTLISNGAAPVINKNNGHRHSYFNLSYLPISNIQLTYSF